MRGRSWIGCLVSLWILTAAVAPVRAAGAEPGRAAGQREAEGAGWLGVSLQEATPELREGMEIAAEGGVLVSGVNPGSPAEKAGLREGDLIVRVGDRKVDAPRDAVRAVRAGKPGETTRLEILRDGSSRTVEVKLGAAPERPEAPRAPRHAPRAMGLRGMEERAYLGVQVNDLGPALGEYFGLPEGRGALVLEVEEESPASAGGLRPGDVILEIGDRKVEDSADLFAAIGEARPGDKLRLKLRRKGKELDQPVELAGHPGLAGNLAWRDDAGHGRMRVFELQRGGEDMRELREQLDELRRELDDLRDERRN